MSSTLPQASSSPDARRAGERLHGGAKRQPLRQLNPRISLPQTVSWYEIDPGEACTPHAHTGKTETWLIVAGAGIARLGDAEFEVQEGDLLVAEPGTAHGLKNTGSTPLRFVNVVARSGKGPVTTRELADR